MKRIVAKNVNRLKYIPPIVFALFFMYGDLSAEHLITEPMAAHLKKRYTDDLGGLLKKRYIRVLTTFNKTNFFISGGGRFGFEYSLLKDYEKYLNKKFKRGGLNVVLEFIPVAHDRLIQALVDGYGDIAAAGLTITPERMKNVNFTDPYLYDVDEIVVTHKRVKKMKTLEALSGKKVYVRQSSSYFGSLVSLNKKFKSKGLRPVEIVEADENLETEDILELVNSGAVEITIADSHIAAIWARIFKDIRVPAGLKVRGGGTIAWMVRKKNPELKRSLNGFIKTHKKGTLLGNIYFNRYYKNTKWIKNPLSKGERKKFDKYKELFRKYSSKYGFDRLLVVALAYQESGLDNDKRNPSGAVGVMQVLPDTAADKNVGIPRIRRVENNIHAGVKYLAFLRDRYFDDDDDDLRERDRLRFVLASYNAGPGKIRRARRLAEKMGLDRNKWFRNVEMAALKIIGRETVRYVSNINKYYVLFKLAAAKEKLRGSEKMKIRRD